MKLPGLAWLELAAGRDHDGMTTYSQRAIFQPRGLAGHAYWRTISPFHGVVFGGMLRNITAAAERAARSADKPALAAEQRGKNNSICQGTAPNLASERRGGCPPRLI